MFALWSLLVAAVVVFSAAPASAKPGGWSNVDNNDKGLLRALTFAMSEYNAKSNEEFGRKVMTVRKAKQQIVSGVNYEAQVETGQTTCTKPIDNIDDCQLHESPEMLKRTRCTFKVHMVPWMNIIEVKKSVCYQ